MHSTGNKTMHQLCIILKRKNITSSRWTKILRSYRM